jgi:hypothetical protein
MARAISRKTRKPRVRRSPTNKRAVNKVIRKKVSDYTSFMKSEMQRLKTAEPSMSYSARFKIAAANWKKR